MTTRNPNFGRNFVRGMKPSKKNPDLPTYLDPSKASILDEGDKGNKPKNPELDEANEYRNYVNDLLKYVTSTDSVEICMQLNQKAKTKVPPHEMNFRASYKEGYFYFDFLQNRKVIFMFGPVPGQEVIDLINQNLIEQKKGE